MPQPPQNVQAGNAPAQQNQQNAVPPAIPPLPRNIRNSRL
jgi:hypothetical protein